MPYKVDVSQKAIVAKLRQYGATVQILADVGRGVPDLLVGYVGKNFLMEVKSSKGKLSNTQQNWHLNWRGQVNIVRTEEDALNIIFENKP